MGRTVNPLLRLRRFESCSPHFFFAGVAQLVERQPSKLQVAGSSLVSRSFSISYPKVSQCSSEVEHFLGKEEVTGSIPVIGSLDRFLSGLIN